MHSFEDHSQNTMQNVTTISKLRYLLDSMEHSFQGLANTLFNALLCSDITECTHNTDLLLLTVQKGLDIYFYYSLCAIGTLHHKLFAANRFTMQATCKQGFLFRNEASL